MRGLLIVGAGGHGKVVADVALEMGRWNKIAFLDDKSVINSSLGWPIIGTLKSAERFIKDYCDIAVAIGKNQLRVQLLLEFKEKGFHLPTIVHPKAYISRYARIDEGSVFFAQTVVNADAKIGFGSIINTGSTVDHDCMVGQGVHLSPGVHLGGKVSIDNYSWLGVGVSVINNIHIGNNSIIGAGAVVISDIPDNVTAVGVPARVTSPPI